MKIPERLRLANLPTGIEKLERLSRKLGGPDIYMKRDDQTGTEVSGNKIRKLEFSVYEALNQGCDCLITCGGIQSNHCRAVSAVAAKLGLKAILVLRKGKGEEIDGNLLLDKLLGAEVHILSAEEGDEGRDKLLEKIKADAGEKGLRPYFIPGGASNGIGALGYFNAVKEIMIQEKELGVSFDAIVAATGSGGTYSGLKLGAAVLNYQADIIGVNVSDNAGYFKDKILGILEESLNYLNVYHPFLKEDINLIDGYVGEGYALSRPEELEFIYSLAKLEGVILDPVYTGKAMYGLTEEIKKGSFKKYRNVLFIHTGGLFGLFPQRSLFKL